jgi:hypothetical protein
MIQFAEAKALNTREIIKSSEFKDLPGADEVLKECLYRSTVRWVAYVDDKPAVVWGLAPRTTLSDQAYLWMLTTSIAAEHKFMLVRYSQRFVEDALKYYSALFGHVEAGNFSAKRWLRWLGAEFGESDGKQVKFVIRRK